MERHEAKDLKIYGLWARLPRIAGWAAASLALLTLCFSLIFIFRSRSQPEFKMRGFPTELSKDLVAEVAGYERTEFDGGARKYYIRADRARTFSDNHQELENVFIEVFDPSDENRTDRITSEKAVYIPEENKNFTAYLAGRVNIVSRDNLVIDGDQVTYTKANDTAAIDEPLQFRRFNIKGRADSAKALISARRVELAGNVEVLQFQNETFSGEPRSRLNSGFATYDQGTEKIDLGDGVRVFANGEGSATTELKSSNANVRLKVTDNNRELAFAEAVGNVEIQALSADRTPTAISSSYASYDKIADKFELRFGVRINTGVADSQTQILSETAVYNQRALNVELSGNAEITQLAALVRGNKISANLYPTRKLKDARVLGNAFVSQSEDERNIEVSADELSVAYSPKYLLSSANARSSAEAVLTPKEQNSDYSVAKMKAARGIDAIFRADGTLERMFTDGRTTLQMDAPAGRPDGATRSVTANIVRAFFTADGKSLTRAEAEGNAELTVEPVQKLPENYKTSVFSPRFDCVFFAKGNNARECEAASPTRTQRVPLVPSADRGEQILTAQRLTATFIEQSRDLDRLEASGGCKFTELDRNAAANRMVFTNSDGVVRLREGEPTVWDSRARIKAREIDWDTRAQRTSLRDNVSATYYSPEKASGAVPFSGSGRPVFVTSDSADIDHRAETATFSGNARGWQENNYVRANRLTINQKEGRFDADGAVQSLLYDVKRTENGRTSNTPVSVSAAKMSYFREGRLLRYETNVDVRQGSDRIVSQKAEIYLTENSEIQRSEFEGAVNITQPGRKASADFAVYDAETQFVVLRGRPARVFDAAQGSTEGGEIQMDLRSNRVVNEGRSGANPAGRTRSVYKMKVN